MVSLVELNEENWMDFASLSVNEDQRSFLASNIGIIARGYVYRDSNARVIGIASDGEAVGLLLVRDLDEEPACYDLQQFMIDGKTQGKGYGSKALQLILESLSKELRKSADFSDYRINSVNVRTLKAPRSLVDVFEGLSVKRSGINVKI